MSQQTRRALILIDVQNDYVGANMPIEFPPVDSSLANIGKSIAAARSQHIPIVVVQHVVASDAPFLARGTHGAELHANVNSCLPDHHIVKSMPSAFSSTDLEAWLRSHNIDTLAIAGYMTHNCDLSTVLHAFHAGFAVEFLSDASGAVPYSNRAGSASAEEIHRVTTVVMQSRFAAVMSTSEWIHIIQTGEQPQRDSIYSSNQRARFPVTT